jgi:hypothetical protein
MEDKYFVLWYDEDNGLKILPCTYEQVIAIINEETFDNNDNRIPKEFVDSQDITQKPEYWGDKILIIKGQITLPKVAHFTLD